MGKDFHVREEGEEVHARVLDTHDSFYRKTKSLLVLFQIMGKHFYLLNLKNRFKAEFIIQVVGYQHVAP